jgi:hypothetical protein
MSLGPFESIATCGECGAPLHADQRYCLSCGARHGAPRVDPLGALGFAVEAPAGATSAGIAAAGGDASGGIRAAESHDAPSSARRAPSRRLSAALAAVTLALGAAAGAALGPGPAPSVAAAPQRLVALVVPSAAPATTTTDEEPTPPEDSGSSETPSAASDDTTSTADDSTSADDTTTGTSTDAETTATDTKTTPAAGDDSSSSTTPAATVATVPAHVFVISLTQLDATAFAPTSPLADLVAQGTLLSNYTAAGPSAAANELALLGGQVPAADCVANLAACVLPAGETSLPDQLRTVNLSWRAYVEDPAQRCATTPSARVGISLFTTLSTRKDCATNVVDPAKLDADLAKKAKTPALSLLIPNACHDGSATPCADGAPAGLDGATAPLHALVAKITASAAYKADGVLLIVSDTGPPPPPGADPTTATTATPPGPLGALVLSPRATAARTVDAATGPVALLASIDALLGLDPLGAAAQATPPALDGVLAPPTATASSTFPHRSHPTNPTRRSP